MRTAKHKLYKHNYLFTQGSTFNLKQTGTNYTTRAIDVAGFTEMLISVKIVQTGSGSTGAFKISIQIFDDVDGSLTMSEVLDVCTGISSNQGAGTKYSTVSIGPCLPDPAGINSGTMVALSGAKLQGAKKIQVKLSPTTASDAATSCVATMNIGVTF